MLNKLLHLLFPNPFDQTIKKAAIQNKTRFLVIWNRGLGDIPLGLYALIFRTRSWIPQAKITFLTRKDLAPAFSMLEGVDVLTAPHWERGRSLDIKATLEGQGLSLDVFDVILDKFDPTRSFKWQLNHLIPKLKWKDEWDLCAQKFDLNSEKKCIGVHIQTETQKYYGYEKNWPLSSWKCLFEKIREKQKKDIVLFGMERASPFLMDGVIDLRGRTTLFDALALIKTRCSHLIVPDSGILSLIYYLDASFPLQVISLWSDPKQGVLRQNVPSPNLGLNHIPLIAKDGQLAHLSVDDVFAALCR